MDILTPARILITGASGFVGGYLVQRCRERYPQATLFGLFKESSRTDLAHLHEYLVPLEADMLHPERVRSAVLQARPELVFHLAAQSSVAASWSQPAMTLRVNAEGTIHLLEALRAAETFPRTVIVGSGEQYGIVRPQDNPISEEHPFRPVNPYAVSKAAQDLYSYHAFVAYGLPILRVRPFNLFGPRQTPTFVIASFARQIALVEAGKAEPILATGNLQARRDFLPVQDVVDASIAVAERGQPGEAYNIGSGQAHAIEAILHRLLSLTDVSIRVSTDPARFRPVDQPLLMANIARLHAHTGWQPRIDLDYALKQTLDYWRAMV